MPAQQVVVIRNSPRPEPAFTIPSDASPDDVAAALRELREVAGLDVEVVPLVGTTTAAEFRDRVQAFAADAAHELREADERFIWKRGDVEIR